MNAKAKWFWSQDALGDGPFDTREEAEADARTALGYVCDDVDYDRRAPTPLEDVVDPETLIEWIDGNVLDTWEAGQPSGPSVEWSEGPRLSEKGCEIVREHVRRLNTALGVTLWVEMTDAEIEQEIKQLCSLAQELPLAEYRDRAQCRAVFGGGSSSQERALARVRVSDALQGFIVEALRLEALGREEEEEDA